ncbi:hypothetical protein MBLNU457_4971t2 [Dothideomycetes sp. NU457]
MTTSTDKPTTAWDEARYISSLAQLERLNNQLHTLRTAIPSMVNPLLAHQDGRSDTFVQFRKAAVAASTDFNEFRERWQSDDVQAILAKSSESLDRDEDLSAARELEMNGWIEKAA